MITVWKIFYMKRRWESTMGLELWLIAQEEFKYSSTYSIAIIHGELLFIHPFREGNGRIQQLPQR